jgi:uncharacterized protein
MTEIKMGKNEFYIEESNEIIARIQFIPSGKDVNGRNLIIVNHTVVYEGHNGRGLGKELVNKIAEYARDENLLLFLYVLTQKVFLKVRKSIKVY